MPPDLILTESPDEHLESVIRENFRAHARQRGLAADHQTFAIEVRDGGVLLGGLMARTGRGWLYIERIALPASAQGRGIGRRLMQLAEAEARRRDCKGCYLFTVQFQAPGFYQKLGYTEFGRLQDDPPELTRIWFVKRFADAVAS